MKNKKIGNLNFDFFDNDKLKQKSSKKEYLSNNFAREEINSSVVKRFEKQVNEFPNNIAVKDIEGEITYQNLNRKCNQVAHLISSEYVEELEIHPDPNHSLHNRNEIKENTEPVNTLDDSLAAKQILNKNQAVGLLLAHNIDMVSAIIGTLKAGKIYVPLDLDFPNERLKLIIDDCDCRVIITNTHNYKRATEIVNELSRNIKVFDINSIVNNSENQDNLNLSINPDSYAYILFTSGSTSKPKGVIQNHRNVLHFAQVYSKKLNIVCSDKLLMVAKYTFDAAKMDFFGALLNGATLCLFDLKNSSSRNLLDFVLLEKVTIYHSTPTVYRYFIKLIKEKYVNLQFIRFIVLGGENVVKTDVEFFKKYFGNECIFINGLGPTESTVTLQNFIKRNDTLLTDIVPVGCAVDETEVFILNEKNKEALPLEEGEIIYKSNYLALGYWNNIVETNKKFVDDPRYKGGRVYRSGDWGKKNEDGVIEFIGRKDSQVKIRGQIVNLMALENYTMKLEGIKDCAFITNNSTSGDMLYGFYTNFSKDNEVTFDTVKKHVLDLYPDSHVPSQFNLLEEMPYTATSKIDRNALIKLIKTDKYLGNTIDNKKDEGNLLASPRNETDHKLLKLWSEIIGTSEKQLTIDSNYFEIGGQSLKAIQLLNRIYKIWGVEITLEILFQNPTIRYISDLLVSSRIKINNSIKLSEKLEYYNLSSAQKMMLVLQQINPKGTTYNISQVLTLNHRIDSKKLELIINQIISKHDSLRTSFKLLNKQYVQVINDNVDFSFDKIHYSVSNISELFQDLIKPFDLNEAPLFRAELVQLKDKSILFWDMHHIISDFESLRILKNDLNQLIEKDSLEKANYQYKEFCKSQLHPEKIKQKEKQKSFWLEQLTGEWPQIDLPYDNMRPTVKDYEGAYVNFSISDDELTKLRAYCKNNDITMYMFLYTVFKVMMFKLGNNNDLIVGTQTNGRNQMEFEKVVGMFINTLCVRSYPEGSKSFNSYLSEVKKIILSIYKNQDVQFEEIVEMLSIPRDVSRNPVYDVSFNMFHIDDIKLIYNEHNVSKYISKFDLSLIAVDDSNEIKLLFEYCIKLFNEDTVKRFVGYFKRIISEIIVNDKKNISEIDILSSKEKNDLLTEFNKTDKQLSQDLIHNLFEQQAIKYRDSIVLETQNEQLSYSELNKKSQVLADELGRRGLQPDEFVGIVISDQFNISISILGILKAGGAYVPIDPESPLTRKKYILDDTNLKFLLTQEESLSNDEISKLEFSRDNVIYLNSYLLDNLEYTPIQSSQNASLNNLAYIVYTSGSTGYPKGVLIEHRNISNTIQWRKDEYKLSKYDRVVQFFNYSFDGFLTSFFTPLVSGSRLYLTDSDITNRIDKINEILIKNCFTHFIIVPSLWKLIVINVNAKALSSLKTITLAGDKVSSKLISLTKQKKSELEIINEYGPTENSVATTIYRDLSPNRKVLIGKPIANTKVFILDNHDNIQPIGVNGEICVAGSGLMRGYINKPELLDRKLEMNTKFTNETIYRTGDVGRRLKDGNIEFIGRLDNQIKIRGYRIELNEIEYYLLKHEKINEAVVTLKGQENDKHLIAHYTSDNKINEKDIKSYLCNYLPNYMIPHYFFHIDKMPLTSNGKINRKLLPDYTKNNESIIIKSTDQLENYLTNLWKEILGIEQDKVNSESNFFEMGGGSYHIIQIQKELEKELNMEFDAIDLFKYSTIKSLIEYIQELTNNKEKSNKDEEKIIQEANESLNKMSDLFSKLNS